MQAPPPAGLPAASNPVVSGGSLPAAVGDGDAAAEARAEEEAPSAICDTWLNSAIGQALTMRSSGRNFVEVSLAVFFSQHDRSAPKL